ncbi:se33 [Alphabaculovirus alterspexiguae]|uniref:Se33 n=1 Tax=Spodoptera exigua multiple nucleopolyhedrovirus TaxID=10454 RepID=A0A3G2JTY2_9ABAC|nr:se33 [Spodoptera exigua multiple nucleopolyhedrovirus]AYN44993.1 se33 [Spodoptera exigua multiple nucleopolyhedrovirus]
MDLFKTKNAGQLFNVILNISNLVDTTKTNAQHLFYALCVSYIKTTVNGTSALNTLKFAFDQIIQIEKTLFNKRRVLDYALMYLANHSDGQNLQCYINLQCLDYLMTKYI